jgi:hypothetical protein
MSPAIQGLEQCAPATARQPGNTEDLAAIQVERHVLELARHAEVLDRQRRRGARLRGELFAGNVACDRALGLEQSLPEHRFNQGRHRCAFRRPRERDRAFAQRRHLVGDLEYLGEVMGDEHDPSARRGNVADGTEQRRDLALRQWRRRLVQDQHLLREAQRLGDLDQLLLHRAHFRDRFLEHGPGDAEATTEVVCFASLLAAEHQLQPIHPLRVEKDVVEPCERPD